MAWVTPTTRGVGDIITAAIWNQDCVNNPIALLPIGLEFFIDGGGTAITTGLKGGIEVPGKCDIDRCSLGLDQASTTTIDIWMDSYANYPPTVADTITAAAKPATAAADKDQDSTLAGWTTAVVAGHFLFFNVDANDLATWCLVSLKCSRS